MYHIKSQKQPTTKKTDRNKIDCVCVSTSSNQITECEKVNKSPTSFVTACAWTYKGKLDPIKYDTIKASELRPFRYPTQTKCNWYDLLTRTINKLHVTPIEYLNGKHSMCWINVKRLIFTQMCIQSDWKLNSIELLLLYELNRVVLLPMDR